MKNNVLGLVLLTGSLCCFNSFAVSSAAKHSEDESLNNVFKTGNSSPKANQTQGSARPEAAIKEADLITEVPTDIKTVEELKNYLKRFPEEQVVIKLGAPWCRPCNLLHPKLEELAKSKVGKVKFFQINTDNNPPLSNALKFQGEAGIPVIVTLKNDGTGSFSRAVNGYKWLQEVSQE